MKKNLMKITAAAFAATMAFSTTGLMAYADDNNETKELPVASDEGIPTGGSTEETPVAIDRSMEDPTEAPASLHEEPTLTEVPYEGTPTDVTPVETPIVIEETPTEEIIVTTVTTEVAVAETQTTAIEGTTEAVVTTTTTQQDYSLLTAGSWRSNKGDYTFDASRPSGVFNGSNFTYNVSGSTVTFNIGGSALTGTFSIASADNFTITWSDGSVETFSRQGSGDTATTTTAKTSSSSTSTSKASSSSKSSSSAPAGKTDSPKTGDDFHALPIAAFALTGAAVCFISFRKREDN